MNLFENEVLLEGSVVGMPSVAGRTEADNWSNPDIRPNPFDRSYDGWLKRISNWGKIKITYSHTAENIKRKEITKDAFIKKVSTSDLLKLYGKFTVEVLDLNKLEILRTYVGVDGKMQEEKFIVFVDLRPELKKGLNWFTGLAAW
jgi:hypothetical protein